MDGSFKVDKLSMGEISIKISMMGYKEVNKLVLENTHINLGRIFLSLDTLKKLDASAIVEAHEEICGKPESFISNINIVGSKYHKIWVKSCQH